MDGGGHGEPEAKPTIQPPDAPAGLETAADQAYPIWVDVSGRRMFVVGYTSGGAPYGIFEDEMDVGPDDLDLGNCDQLY